MATSYCRGSGSNAEAFCSGSIDNYVYSYPQVQNEIAVVVQITGNFTAEEASDLANILRAGKLDARARIIQADVVGPSLGKEAISILSTLSPLHLHWYCCTCTSTTAVQVW